LLHSVENIYEVINGAKYATVIFFAVFTDEVSETNIERDIYSIRRF
jgi:hypothetical protein